MRLTRKPWIFAITYVVLSLGVEAALIIFGGLRVPENNAQIAPVILTIPPILAALIVGYRLVEPIINRFTAGLLAGILTKKLTGSA